MLNVLYVDCAEWEFDFITLEVLGGKDLIVEIVPYKDFLKVSLKKIPDVVDNQYAFVVSATRQSAIDVVEAALHLKPKIIFALSDEYGNCEGFIGALGGVTKLLLCNYNHTSYNYPSNSHLLPLGYSTTYLNGSTSQHLLIKPMHSRTIEATFVGAMKSDRAHMLKVFGVLTKTHLQVVCNQWKMDTLPVSPEACRLLHGDSIFVLCGRGNVSIDSFRIYEAAVTGAIPVMVCTKQEFIDTFPTVPFIDCPFVVAETWEEALKHCMVMLMNTDTLQQAQNSVVRWWKSELSRVRTQVEAVLSN